MMNFLKKAVQFVSLTTLLTTSTLIYAETTGYDQISFSSEAKTEVVNDELYASMYNKTQAKTAKALAVKLNSSINKAMKIAKRYPNVKVTTGSQSTYPKYDKKSNIIGWTGQANIDIKSTHLDDASQLIADLQDELVLDNLRFGVSEKRKDKIKADLMLKVAERFQNRAETIAKSWGANGYRVVKVNLNTGNNYYSPVNSVSFSMGDRLTKSAPKALDFSAGNSKINVTASGTIELIR